MRSRIKSNFDLLNIEKEYEQALGDLETALISEPRAKLGVDEARNKIEEKVQGFRT